MTPLLLVLALLGRITEWEHHTSLSGVSALYLDGDIVAAATSGGVAFGTLSASGLEWDSTYAYPGELSHSDVRCLVPDGSGNLWMGTYGGGIDVLAPGGGMSHYGQLEGLPLSLRINAILPDSTVWVGTTEGLCSRELGYFEVWTGYSTGGGLPSDIVNALAVVDSGLVVGTESGIALLRAGSYPGSPSSWYAFPGASGLNVLDLAVFGDTAWAACTDGLYLMPPGGIWSEEVDYPGEQPISLAHDGRSLVVGGKGDVSLLGPEGWSRHTQDLQGQMVRDVVCLGGDSLLLAQTGTFSEERANGNGVALGVPGSFESRVPPGAPSNDLESVTVDERGDLWVGSDDHGAAVLSGGEWTGFVSELPRKFQVFVCRADYSGGVFLAPYNNGMVWVDWKGTPGRDDDELIYWTSGEGGMLNDQVTDARMDASGSLWIGQEPYWQTPSEPSGVSRLTWTPGDQGSASWSSVRTTDGLPSGFVRAVQPVTHSTAWVGTEGGLALVDVSSSSVLRVLGSADGLPSSDIRSLALHPTGDVYVGTANGLALIESSGSVRDVPDVSGSVEALQVDNLSGLWIATSEALYRLMPDGGMEEYNELNSPLLSMELRAMAADPDAGRLHLVTDHGLWSLVLPRGMSGELPTAQVFPNPFLPDRDGILRLAGLPDRPLTFRVFDLTGTLVYESESPDRDRFSWDGSDEGGEPLSSGTYIVEIRQDGTGRLVKLALVR